MAQFIHKGEEKKKYVKQMFNDISKTYDLINILSSFGIDRYWRRSLIRHINLSHNSKLLDVATGTGDVAFGFFKKYNCSIVGVDIAKNMIELAKIKANKYNGNIDFFEGDAEKLTFSNDSFDALTISFGFRNLGSYDTALSEFYRVLNQNGKIAILEFSKPKSFWFAPIFNFYFNKVIPLIGSLLSRKDAYLYLPESVDYFLTRQDVCSKLKTAGFKNISYIDYTFGVATLYIGEKSE
ncbi:MAG: bifunctional demethylmenaquinone methyltransferase/2-methoxy-6-polyprenyl-1,4-benzoquinol methylase UbiE [Candidatus Marinimicrobia bacterium]|nr:bifunctional demethylmenaquinone methyltransferase/2-methoxy-6-polyprenyl-1,4-benzoquinol methylase UbiE [Candidatus Neomarinimicrobiota bacterium]|tara:strand:+ start:21442 stop:22155 length:714 start_codon:yes stop_codon:yes gene_type:complete